MTVKGTALLTRIEQTIKINMPESQYGLCIDTCFENRKVVFKIAADL